MRHSLLIAAGVALVSTFTFAQEMPSDVHQHTNPPLNARFEIMQSELAAKFTFRLDRNTGHISQLVADPDGSLTWENMTVAALPIITSPSRPRFQLFASGLAAKFTFMIDTDTGITWQLVTGDRTRADGTTYQVLSWQLLL
jgi:hypothetical protein